MGALPLSSQETEGGFTYMIKSLRLLQMLLSFYLLSYFSVATVYYWL
jgi:hypothetical protein